MFHTEAILRARHNVSDESGVPIYGPTLFRLALSFLVVVGKKKRGHLGPYQALHNLDGSPPNAQFSFSPCPVAPETRISATLYPRGFLILSMLQGKHILGDVLDV